MKKSAKAGGRWRAKVVYYLERRMTLRRTFPDRYKANEWARPIWYGIRETDTLQAPPKQNDERHVAPLQLGVIERCVRLWSNPGDVVLSPFAGIGSEGYEAVRLGRRFIGVELKPEYFNAAVKNLKAAERQADLPTLFTQEPA